MRLILEKDIFICNLCEKHVSRKEGIALVTDKIKRIRKEDKFRSKRK